MSVGKSTGDTAQLKQQIEAENTRRTERDDAPEKTMWSGYCTSSVAGCPE